MSSRIKMTTRSSQQLTLGEIFLSFKLIRERRKTIEATVFPSQAVLVKAPLEASSEQIEQFLRRKILWVRKQQRFFSNFQRPRKKQYVSGETFRYRGRSYKLLLRKSDGCERVSPQPGILRVETFNPKKREQTRKLVDNWYRERAKSVFAKRLDACFLLFPCQTKPKLMVRKMTRRWGSYSKTTHRVTLNLELIQASTCHLDYVIFHELCHLIHPKHNAGFYRLLEALVPNWEKLKMDLERSAFT